MRANVNNSAEVPAGWPDAERPRCGLDRCAICVDSLDVSYAEQGVLHNVSLEVPEHRITVLLGARRAGKSTLLRCLNRMIDQIPAARITRGAVFVEGKRLSDRDVDVDRLRERVVMVFQRSHALAQPIGELFRHALRGRQVTAPEAVQREAVAALDRVGLGALWENARERLGSDLDRADQRCLSLARALVMGPRVLLLDEPCAGLEPKCAESVQELVRGLAGEYSVVVATANAQLAANIGDRIYEVRGGRVFGGHRAQDARSDLISER